MDRVNQKEENFRVLLIGTGDNTERDKEAFCIKFSKHYEVPQSQIRKIVDRCPAVFKKGLSLKKAEVLAKRLISFGGKVSIQERRKDFPIYLEFEMLSEPKVALESAYLRKTPSGTWNLTGRIKNISSEELNDIWILVQLFDDFQDLITFEEVPIPINPLPRGEASPFKIIFEKEIPIFKVSVAFKNSSGNPIGTKDLRKEWRDVAINGYQKLEVGEVKNLSGEIHLEGLEDENIKLTIENETFQEPSISLLQEEMKRKKETKIIKEIPEEALSFLWIDEFKKAIENYYQRSKDKFIIWFENIKKEKGFENSYHSLLTILIHGRFNQSDRPEKALENTQKVFTLAIKPNLSLEEIPLLDGTTFFTHETWKELFFKAIPKIKEVANEILKRKKWVAIELESIIRIIPHMSDKNSRWTLRSISNLLQNVIEIDFSNHPVHVEDSLYRVASRLGIINPLFDHYHGRDSMGDKKIQSFAKMAFPNNPFMIEEPMNRIGLEDEGGSCFPVKPRCERCLFEPFCPRLYIQFNPSEKGMRV